MRANVEDIIMSRRTLTATEVKEEGGERGIAEGVEGNVLVAAGERSLVSEFEVSLRPDYNVWSTTSGRQALDIVDNEVDVVVVTSETTDMTGREVVSKTKARGIDCKAATVGREDADSRFDGYVPTPVTPERIIGTVDELSKVREYHQVLGGYFDAARRDNPVSEDYERWTREVVEGFGNEEFKNAFEMI